MIEHEGHRHAVKRGMRGRMHLENFPLIEKMIKTVLMIPFIHKPGQKNALYIRLESVEFAFADLPESFDNTTFLFISDPHIDCHPELIDAIIRLTEKIDYEFCVLGGDYTFDSNVTNGQVHAIIENFAVKVTQKSKVYGVLGNHDRYATAEVLEHAGVKMLINEHDFIEKNGQHICLVGLDDCHYYDAQDIRLADTRENVFKIMVSHSPEMYKQAALAGFSLFLAGHTHGGQVCLPGGWPLITCATVPLKSVKGKWRHKNMIGYTSRGAGTSLADVRFCCPPEITLITLKKSQKCI